MPLLCGALRVYSEPDTYFFISLFYFIPVKQILRYGIKYNMVTYFYQLIHLLRQKSGTEYEKENNHEEKKLGFYADWGHGCGCFAGRMCPKDE